jgi:hypothetical protein
VTYIISAHNSLPLPEYIQAQLGFRRQWVRINEPLMASGSDIHSLPVLSDDFVPVERLLANLLLSKKGI